MAILLGTVRDDSMTGGTAPDTMFGDSGNDFITGSAGNDAIFAGGGHDAIFGSRGNDVIFADASEPNLFVGAGNDLVGGGGGNDRIVTGAGRDSLAGDSGNDTLEAGAGRDVLSGGTGNDVIFWDQRDIAIDGGRGNDRLVTAGADLDLRRVGAGRITNIETVDMTGGGTGDRLTLNRADVLDVSSTGNTLRVLGDTGDILNIVGAFTEEGTSGRFHVFRLGGATLLVETDVSVFLGPT